MVFLYQCEKDESAPIVKIPDNNFLNALIELGIDTNRDGQISQAEAEVVISLVVSNKSISDMTGIEQFINLETLYCINNQLTTIDVSNNNKLRNLSCQVNQLTSLDVFNNTSLEYLDCHSNQLTTLDVSNNTVLSVLSCSWNQLSNLDVSNNTRLTYFGCSHNQLTSLDVSNNTALIYLLFKYNQIISLDVSSCTSLSLLSCSSNKLTTLDVSNNTALGSGSNSPPDLRISDMPTLFEVCVWTMPFPPTGVLVDTTGSPNVYFTTDCSK